MEHRQPKRVEDYTTANLILIFVNLLWIFGVIWAHFGLLAVILTGWALNHGITRLAQYKASREIQWPSDA
ncbi:histidinol phosphate aminotransferase [Marivita sp. XM-24bin2]|uniref:histidinol phosphate aminotransferase n=1 Tax=unclassified Marivita TaxID=2632480 RepID=UPI000D7B823B|nr:histidinol phosphate aminotransferase [Marivita sp. XM-24bin2]MCR9108854.1 histidinol phosphate aminotransferase [Paracoccaceae bacterium]PWL34972.1 MAG: histidinol phosphate aminotransferase [Marivita sp. XM-24bin2]